MFVPGLEFLKRKPAKNEKLMGAFGYLAARIIKHSSLVLGFAV